MVQILDSTLREGAQWANVYPNVEKKTRLLQLVEKFGIRLIEIGHPGISREQEVACTKVAASAATSETLMHSRANADEIRAVVRTGADWVGIWASINEIARKTKFSGRSEADILLKVREAVSRAKDDGLRVRFTVEDASRTPWGELVNVAGVATEAGADRISLADTVGVLEPAVCYEMVSKAIRELDVEIEVHLHNDLGLALANSLSAASAGASVIDASILGVGERAGITDIIELCVALNKFKGDKRFDLPIIPELIDSIEEVYGYSPDPLRPLSGSSVFTHSSKYHLNAATKDPKSYEPFDPAIIGRSRKFGDANGYRSANTVASRKLHLGKPILRESSELHYHRDGPGMRWVLIDQRVDPRASLYVMQRFVPKELDWGDKHVDPHVHHCDSVLVFFGHYTDGEGLSCGMQVGENYAAVQSPSTIFIPAGVEHTYHYISGQGIITNIVLNGDYNGSLIP